MGWQQRLQQALIQRQQSRGLRQRTLNQQVNARGITIDNQRYLNFSGNDYLGLSHDPRVIAAWQQGAERYGTGAGGSGHVTGYCYPHAVLETQLAEWLGYSRALLFISGFAANQAIITALCRKDDRILADKLAHASLLEAASFSPATLRRFAHNQISGLQKLLVPPSSGETLVVTEGVFSMDGDMAPLARLLPLTQQHHSWLMVDDAHGIGVMGEGGRGSCWQHQVQPALLVVTFGKAFGIGGAAVLCDSTTADYLLQFARHIIYSTAMPPAQAYALQTALQVVQQGDDLRQQLAENIAYFRRGAKALPYRLGDSCTAIQPLIVGENQATLDLSAALRSRGCWITAIRPPTVPPGTARLRITLNASHQPQDIDLLLESLYATCGE